MDNFNVGREIALDTETTGLSPKTGHKIVEIGCVELINRIPTGVTFHKYVNPNRDMPDEAFRVHGLSSEFLSDKPIFFDVADEFLEFIGTSKLIIHNAKFDVGFINAELKWSDKKPVDSCRAFCTLIEARKKFPGSPASLDALCRRFRIEISGREKHGALIDAELLAEMYLELMGGTQVNLALSTKSEKKIIKESDTQKLSPRECIINESEVESHNEFIKKISEPLWDKYKVS